MNHEAVLRDLATERLDDLMPLLQRVFETGYREGMAAVGTVVPVGQKECADGSQVATPDDLRRGDSRIALDRVPGTDSEVPAEAREAEVLVSETVAGNGDADEAADDDDDPADDENDEVLLEDETPSDGQPVRRRFRGIRASATVGGLLRKIERVFKIEERFDLVVRVEHPGSGRAPKRHMRLSAYAREG